MYLYCSKCAHCEQHHIIVMLSSPAYHLQLVPACLGGMVRQVRGHIAAEVILLQVDWWEVEIHGHCRILHFQEWM